MKNKEQNNIEDPHHRFIYNMLEETKNWIEGQIKDKNSRWFSGERSEIKSETLHSWRWKIFSLQMDIKNKVDFNNEDRYKDLQRIKKLYTLGVMKWPLGRIRRRAKAVKRQNEKEEIAA